MDMSVPRNTTLLEKWLEDMPNSNNSTNIKKERKDFRDIFASNSVTTSTSNQKNPIPATSVSQTLNPGINSTTKPQTNSSSVTNTSNQSKVKYCNLQHSRSITLQIISDNRRKRRYICGRFFQHQRCLWMGSC